MASEELQTYISRARNVGLSDQQIRKNLENAGWSADAINKALPSAGPSIPEVSQQKPSVAQQAPKEDSKKKQPTRPSNGPPTKRPRSKFAIASFIISFLLPPLGIILGIIALIKVHNDNLKGNGFAIAAIIFGILGTIGWVLLAPVILLISMQGISQENIEQLQQEQLEADTPSTHQIQCGVDMDIEVISIGPEQSVCLDDGQLMLTVENQGLRDIVGWKLTMLGTGGVYDDTLSQPLASGGLTNLEFSYDPSQVGDSLDMIRISPQIIVQEDTITCQHPELEWEGTEINQIRIC